LPKHLEKDYIGSMQADTSRKTSRRFWFFFLGCLFEGLLFVTLWWGWREPLFVHLYNFSLMAHIPLFWIAEAFRMDASAILLLFLWAVIWAVIFSFVARIWTRLEARFLIFPKRKLLFKIGLGFITALFLASAAISAWSKKSIPFTGNSEITTVVEGNTAFAFDLYQKIKERPGNLFFSPYSISTSLAMASAGAKGQTEIEMTNTLHFQLSREKTDSAFGELGKRLNQIERWNRITLKTANGLWAQSGHSFTKHFLETARQGYNAEIQQVDFQQSADIEKKIDHWVAHQTEQKIKTAMNEAQLSRDVRLVLCNAIYFKGKWKTQFKQRDTKPKPFYINQTETIEVPMMYQKADFKMTYSDDMTVDMLELPYSGNDLSMIILLPIRDSVADERAENDLVALEKNLTAGNLRAWLTKLDRAELDKVHVYFPRFTTSQSFELTKELKSLGMNSAFNEAADFSGMNGTTNLFISDVLHKSFVEVNEAGTTAAAITYEIVKTKGMDGRFVVDHPFIFLIRENATGSILFIGRILDPRN
jgi:serpin B